ncbi:MAG: globin domain-containing protein [Jiangellaceae bacterium]
MWTDSRTPESGDTEANSDAVAPTATSATETTPTEPAADQAGTRTRSWFEPGQRRVDNPGTAARRVAIDPVALDVAALNESMAWIEESREQLGHEFYATLFTQYPEFRDMFPLGMEIQRSRLVNALLHIVGTVDDRPTLDSYLGGLGRDHRKFGVLPEHYRPFGSALIHALRAVLAYRWTDRHEKAWADAYDEVARIMLDAVARDALVSPPWWDGEVVFHRRVLDDLAVIQVRPHTEYPYRPGQHCYIASPHRPKMWRAYSMASAPRADNNLEFHVRAVGAGWVSSSLVWRTQPGDVLRLGAPQGVDLADPDSDQDLLCIAAGTGVAPTLAALQELERKQDGRRVHVFYAGRDRDGLYALPHLESIGVRYRELTVVPVVSPEGSEDRSPALIGNIVSAYGDWRRHRVYTAGPTAMVHATLDRLRTNGVPEEQIVSEDYGTW